MTQPAKVQEPSMEEILASIRRIIADDEAKPPAAEKPASPPPRGQAGEAAATAPAAKAPVMKDIPPSAIAPAAQAGCRRAQACTAAARRTQPVSNSQDDIDAMLAGLDEATSEAEIRPPQPDGEVFELTDEMALPDPCRRRGVPSGRVPQDRTAGRSRICRDRRCQNGASAAGLRAAAV